MPGSFAHLHVHTEYSMLDGAARVDDLFAEAARMGMPALAMTDHGQLFGAVDFYLAGQKHGVKPILGIEAYLAPGSRFEKQRRDTAEPYSHLTLLAENQTGYLNLLRLASAASLEGHFYKPRMDRELFARYGEGLIATSGCLGSEVNQRLLKGDRKGAAATLAEFRDLFGAGNYFVELHDHGLP
jgi:DNA polymerase-3 subunit alpha